MWIVLRASQEGGASRHKPPTVCQHLSVFSHPFLPIAAQVACALFTDENAEAQGGKVVTHSHPARQWWNRTASGLLEGPGGGDGVWRWGRTGMMDPNSHSRKGTATLTRV